MTTPTPEQQRAINHLNGPCLVIAGAGTGKTRVITERIANLILNQGVEPEKIVALTFTDKAATEMQERLDQLLPYGVFGTTPSTFHSFCHDILRRHCYVVGVDANARLIGRAEEVSLLRANLSKLPLRLYKPAANPVMFLRQLAGFFDRAKEEQITPQQLEDHAQAALKAATDEAEQEKAARTQELAACYQVALELYREANILTYADLMHYALAILQQSPQARKEEQERTRYLLIDEFQDTNTIQAEIAYLLAGKQANIFVVGDDDQAIYRFRGANVTNILNFRSTYPTAELISLRNNFRSGQQILDAAYSLIQHNNPHRLEAQTGLSKKLTANQEHNHPVTQLRFSHSSYESAGVATKISEYLANGYAPADIAILARGHGQLLSFEQELLSLGIPVARQRDGSFYEQPVIEQALSYLRFLVKPHNSYNLFFLLTEAPFHIPDTELRQHSVQAKRLNNSLWDQLGTSASLSPELTMAKERLAAALAAPENRRPTEALRRHIQESGWQKQLVSLAIPENITALNQLNTLYYEVKNFEQLHRPVVLAQYLNHVEDLISSKEDIRVESEVPEDNDGVRLLTVHASKGLEFPIVFVVNMAEGRFPSNHGGGDLPLPEELVTPQKDTVKYEEERRLAYVAFTRAKEHLYLTYSQKYETNKRNKKPSPFLIEACGAVEAPLADQPLEIRISQVAESPQTTTLSIPTSYTASALESFETSPANYLIEHVYKLTKEETVHASFGSSIHQVLHAFLLARKNGGSLDLATEYARCWQPEDYEDKETEQRWREEGLAALTAYIAELPARFTPYALERSVELLLPSGIRIFGKIDRLDQNEDGTLRIVDYKTGRKEAKPADIKNNLPLAVYAAALRQHKEPVTSAALHYVMTGQKLLLPVDDIFIEKCLIRTQEIIDRIEEAYRTNSFPATKTFWD